MAQASDRLQRPRWAVAAGVWLAAAAAAGAAGAAAAQGPTAPTRGQLLYETHCIACHDTQMHWREQRLVKDWPGLVEQVRRWQARARLDWPEADVRAVAEHLNQHIYRLPRPERRAALGLR